MLYLFRFYVDVKALEKLANTILFFLDYLR